MNRHDISTPLTTTSTQNNVKTLPPNSNSIPSDTILDRNFLISSLQIKNSNSSNYINKFITAFKSLDTEARQNLAIFLSFLTVKFAFNSKQDNPTYNTVKNILQAIAKDNFVVDNHHVNLFLRISTNTHETWFYLTYTTSAKKIMQRINIHLDKYNLSQIKDQVTNNIITIRSLQEKYQISTTEHQILADKVNLRTIPVSSPQEKDENDIAYFKTLANKHALSNSEIQIVKDIKEGAITISYLQEKYGIIGAVEYQMLADKLDIHTIPVSYLQEKYGLSTTIALQVKYGILGANYQILANEYAFSDSIIQELKDIKEENCSKRYHIVFEIFNIKKITETKSPRSPREIVTNLLTSANVTELVKPYNSSHVCVKLGNVFIVYSKNIKFTGFIIFYKLTDDQFITFCPEDIKFVPESGRQPLEAHMDAIIPINLSNFLQKADYSGELNYRVGRKDHPPANDDFVNLDVILCQGLIYFWNVNENKVSIITDFSVLEVGEKKDWTGGTLTETSLERRLCNRSVESAQKLKESFGLAPYDLADVLLSLRFRQSLSALIEEQISFQKFCQINEIQHQLPVLDLSQTIEYALNPPKPINKPKHN